MTVFKLTLESDEDGILRRTEYITEQMSLAELHTLEQNLIVALANANHAITDKLCEQIDNFAKMKNDQGIN